MGMIKLHKLTRDLTIVDILYDRGLMNYCIFEVCMLCLLIQSLGEAWGFIERPELDPKTAIILFGILVLIVGFYMVNLYMKYVIGVKD